MRSRPPDHALLARSRSRAVLLVAISTLVAYACIDGPAALRALAQTVTTSSTTSTSLPTTTTVEPTTSTPTTTTPAEWQGSKWTKPTTDGATVVDGVFDGVFRHRPSNPRIDHVELEITYSTGFTHPPACGVPPGPYTQQATSASSTTTPSDPADGDKMVFDFEVGFRCNGLYDVTAHAELERPAGEVSHDLELRTLRVAVPPQPPSSLVATDNGNHVVTVAWQPPTDQPPDLIGYRISRQEASSANVEVLGDAAVDARSFDDGSLPAEGGSYFYRVQTLRSSPNGPVASEPVATGSPLAVRGSAGGGGGGGGSASGTRTPADPGSGGSGVQHFDDTLPADEGELGAGDPLANVPGGDTVQRFVSGDGMGLVTPSAVALNIAVWAALLLFLTRRAAHEDRMARLELEFEHSV